MYSIVLTKIYQIKPIAWEKIASSASKCNQIKYDNTVLKRHTLSKECWMNLRKVSFLKLARVHQLKVFVYVGACEIQWSNCEWGTGQQYYYTACLFSLSFWLFNLSVLSVLSRGEADTFGRPVSTQQFAESETWDIEGRRKHGLFMT